MNCNLTNDIQLDDLPEEWRQIAELIGLDDTLRLIEARQGEPIHCPKLQSVQRAARNRAIRAEFKKGADYRDLARKFGLTVRWVREILSGDSGPCRAVKPVDKQLKLF